MKLRYIDALRGIAILMVIVVHTGQQGTNEYPAFISNLIYQGARGVQLFFLASAFTLFLSYHYRQGKETNTTRKFFVRRFFRIAPMYYIGIIYFLFQNGLGPRYWLGDETSITASNIISNVFFVHGVNPYWITSLVPGGWSITVEMMFYALIPILVSRIKSSNHAVLFTLISLIVSIILKYGLLKFPLIGHERLWNEFLFLYFPSQLPIFGLGIIAFFLIIKKDFQVSAIYFLIFAALIGIHFFRPIIPAHFLYGIAFLILIFSLSKYELSLFVNRFTVFMGKISYSAYLVHFAVLHWLAHFDFVDFISIDGLAAGLFNFLIRFFVVVLLTSGVSWVFYRFVEQPFVKFGKRLIVEEKVPV